MNTICWNDSGTHLLSGSDDQHLNITNPFNEQVFYNVLNNLLLKDFVFCGLNYCNICRAFTEGTLSRDCKLVEKYICIELYKILNKFSM